MYIISHSVCTSVLQLYCSNHYVIFTFCMKYSDKCTRKCSQSASSSCRQSASRPIKGDLPHDFSFWCHLLLPVRVGLSVRARVLHTSLPNMTVPVIYNFLLPMFCTSSWSRPVACMLTHLVIAEYCCVVRMVVQRYGNLHCIVVRMFLP